jgi:hypothetical protein
MHASPPAQLSSAAPGLKSPAPVAERAERLRAHERANGSRVWEWDDDAPGWDKNDPPVISRPKLL